MIYLFRLINSHEKRWVKHDKKVAYHQRTLIESHQDKMNTLKKTELTVIADKHTYSIRHRSLKMINNLNTLIQI